MLGDREEMPKCLRGLHPVDVQLSALLRNRRLHKPMGLGQLRNSKVGYGRNTCVVVDFPRVCTFDSSFSWFQKPWLCCLIKVPVPEREAQV